ncbi:MAG: hypothetical protein K2X11_05545 [Acetobacteraceae bacterium]|nr:hypothetical protein [Acetobacteraceae bacterium]
MQPQIVPFPGRPEDRLRHALRNLEAALDDQARAIGAFRDGIASLGHAMHELEGTVTEFRGRLGEVGLDLAEAREQALRLERTADLWLKN